VSGPAGSVVNYTVSDGTTTVSGTGTIGADGMLPVVLDLSGLSDSVLTTTVTPVGAASLSTTLIKSTAPPGAPGLSTLAYANLVKQAATTFTITGVAGLFVSMTVYDGTNWQDGFGYLDSTGTLSLTLDLSRLADGPLTATVTIMNAEGSTSSSSLIVRKVTVAQVSPRVSLQIFDYLDNVLAFSS